MRPARTRNPRGGRIGSVAALVAAGVVLVGALSGCGGGGGSGPKQPISKADFIRRADAICASGAKRVGAIPGLNFDPATATRQQLPQIAGVLGRITGELQFEHDAIARLPRPVEGRALVTQILGYLQQFIHLLQSEQEAAAGRNLAGFEALSAQETQPGSPILLANQRAKEFGLKVCGSGSAQAA